MHRAVDIAHIQFPTPNNHTNKDISIFTKDITLYYL